MKLPAASFGVSQVDIDDITTTGLKLSLESGRKSTHGRDKLSHGSSLVNSHGTALQPLLSRLYAVAAAA